MTDLCYCPGGILDTKGNPSTVSARLAELDVISLPASELERQVLETPGIHDTHPVRYTGSPLDRWQEETHRTEDGLQPDDWWQTTVSYADMSYEDAKKQARSDLWNYLNAYRTSQFVAGGFTWSADPTKSNTYNTLELFSRFDTEPFSYWIMDIDETEHEFTTINEIRILIERWRDLWIEAQDITLTAWQAVRDTATTADDVRTILDDLVRDNPVPGTGA